MTDRSNSKIFVVVGDKPLRTGLQSLISSFGYAIESFESAEAFIEARDANQSGCLVLDVQLPGISGLQLQKHLTALNDTLSIIFIAGQGNLAACAEAMKLGAIDFLPKPFRERELLEAIKVALDNDISRRDQKLQTFKYLTKYRSMTEREHEILALIIKDKDQKEIANLLGISESSAKNYCAKVMAKMDAKSHQSLAQMLHMIKPFLAPRQL